MAFKPSVEKADLIASLIGVIGAAIAYFYPSVSDFVGLGAWLIPIVFFLLLFISRLILAPYWVYMEEQQQRIQAETRLQAMKAPLPKVFFSSARQAQMHRPSPVVEGSIPIYELLQAWFENRPNAPTGDSTAKQVSAVIEFWTRTREETLFQVHGQWARSTAPDHVGFRGTTSAIDIAPGHLAAKLIVALKYRDEKEAYAYSDESLRDYSDGRNPSLKLNQGEYNLRIRLRGIGVDQEFWFSLTNPGSGESLQLTILDHESPKT